MAKITSADNPGNRMMELLLKQMPDLVEVHTCCPAYDANQLMLFCGAGQPLSWLIVHLNDDHRWTREQIADWLDAVDADLSFEIPE